MYCSTVRMAFYNGFMRSVTTRHINTCSAMNLKAPSRTTRNARRQLAVAGASTATGGLKTVVDVDASVCTRSSVVAHVHGARQLSWATAWLE